jgi:cytochrome b subunit of formate dehydrogenase
MSERFVHLAPSGAGSGVRARGALRGIFDGTVDREWALHHYPRWKPERRT